MQTKKRLGLFSPRRLGSPPPELPNYEMDTSELLILCKRHFGNQLFPLVNKGAERNSQRRCRERKLRLLSPALAIVGGDPELAGGCCNPAMLRVRKLDGGDVAGEGSAHLRG